MIKVFKRNWEILSRTIYTGKRLKENLRALTYVSIATALLGLVLMVYNAFTGVGIMFIAAAATFLGGAGCGVCAGILKNREAAAAIPTVFCAIVFTIYAVYGLGEGTAMFWSLLMPIGMSYFVSARNGILLSFYYSLLYVVLFYTPLKSRVAAYYSEALMARFPLLFISLSAFTTIAMLQYHRVSLVEIDYADELNREVERQTRLATERADHLEIMSQEMVETLAVTIDAKDKYTNGHSFRVSWYAMALARSLGWSEEEIQELGREALLHDIGKIGVPDAVLNKPGRLTNVEFKIIQSHTLVGDDILSHSGTLLGAAKVARNHHERYDGKGYPDGISGEEIPLHARLVAVADTYDAMRSDRIYRKGLPEEIIREELIRNRGTQFDPEILDVFLRLMDTDILDEIAAREIFQLNEAA